MRYRFIKTEGIVLNTVKFGEGHSIVRLFTEKYGKIDASAFGVRKTKSRFGSRLEPFTVSSFLLYHKNEESPYTIKDVDVSRYNSAIREDLNKILIGNALIEPVICFVEKEQRDRELYNLLSSALTVLEEVKPGKTMHLHSMYDLQFLSIMGYRRDSSACIHCGRWIGDDRKFTDSLYGYPVCSTCCIGSAVIVSDGAVEFVEWAQKNSLACAEKVTMNEATYKNIRTVIEHIYMTVFHKKLEIWNQLKSMFDYSY